MAKKILSKGRVMRWGKGCLPLACAVLLLGGCSSLAPADRNGLPISLPQHFSLYTQEDAGTGFWWQSFASRELDTLVDEALSGNFEIQTALAKLREARAEARKAGADLSPILDFEGGGEKAWQETTTESGGKSSTQSKSFSAVLAAGYELDLWGRLKALHQSELLEYQATQEDLEAGAVTVAAEVVTTWIDILSLRQQMTLAREQIQINQKMFALQELRFINGQGDTLAVSQQNQALAEAKALLPPLALEEQTLLSTLAILLGRADTSAITITQTALPDLIALPQTGLPVDLLAARPDVRAAGLRLQSMDWQVSAARADRLPALTLAAGATFTSGSLDLLFSNWITTLAASVSGPIFDGGYRANEVARARAEADRYLAVYGQTVAEAVQEVEKALFTEKHQAEYIRLLQEQLTASERTVQDALLQYMNGQNNYLDYLSAWTSVQALQRQLVEEQAILIKNRVSLYRSLGGDWSAKRLEKINQQLEEKCTTLGK